MKKQLVLITISAIALLATAFIINSKPTSTANQKLKVAATIFPIYDILTNIGGDKIIPIQIMPSTASEHTFEPGINEQQSLIGSELIFKIGLDLDTWIDQLAVNVSPNAKVVSLDKNIDLITLTEAEESGSMDPHYWLSPKNAIQIARTITDELISIDPENANYYQTRFNDYSTKLQASFDLAKTKISGLNNKSLITFHEAFSYFAKDLGLTILTTIEPFPGKEPSAEYLNEVVKTIKEHNVKALFKEPQLSDSLLIGIAQDNGATIYTLDPIGGATADRTTYIENFQYNVDTIVNALD